MTWDRDKYEKANFDLGVLGTGLAVASLALALNRKSGSGQTSGTAPKFKKIRGKDRWMLADPYGEKPYWFEAALNADGSLTVARTIGVGQKEVRGVYDAPDLKTAAAMAEDIVANHVPTFWIPEMKPCKRKFSDDWYEEGIGPSCPNCGAYDEVRGLGQHGLYGCGRCGCVFDREREQILWDKWDHRVFDGYRKETESERSRTYSGGKMPLGYTESKHRAYVTPEVFDSQHYSMLVDYENPKDRRRILSFSRRRR